MEKEFSIIYANRNREPERILQSLQSLSEQSHHNFEVIFVDYGSDPDKVQEYREFERLFYFLKAYFLDVPQLLWNKSKALNYGILQATGEYIFIADVDIIFHPNTTLQFKQLASPENFFLFRLGYLDRKESRKLIKGYTYKELKPSRFGSVNGMVLVSKKAMLEISGLDEFFHFYGAEDEDVFARLENANYRKVVVSSEGFYHNWHPSFMGSKEDRLTVIPRIRNVMRINQKHFQRNRDENVLKPKGQTEMAAIIQSEEALVLKSPTKSFKIRNVLAHVEYFLRVELPGLQGEVVQVEFVEDLFYLSIKYRLKNLLGRQSQLYISMKEVNDMVLKEIIFNYRNHNYSFRIQKNPSKIIFKIAL